MVRIAIVNYTLIQIFQFFRVFSDFQCKCKNLKIPMQERIETSFSRSIIMKYIGFRKHFFFWTRSYYTNVEWSRIFSYSTQNDKFRSRNAFSTRYQLNFICFWKIILTQKLYIISGYHTPNMNMWAALVWDLQPFIVFSL